MPAVKPVPPAAIRGLLEAKGYALIAADDFNWAFALGTDDEPVIVPHAVPVVPLEVAFQIAVKVGFNDYFDALTKDTASTSTPDTPQQ